MLFRSESLGGMILEHIVLAAQELELLTGKKRRYGSTRINTTNIYIITTRQHIGNKIITHRYFKPLEYLLMALGSNATGIKTIHQVAISALLNMSERVYKLDNLTYILNDFIFKNEGVLTHLTTPSVNDVVDIMANIHNIFNDVFHYSCNASLTNNDLVEVHEYLKDSLDIPQRPPVGSICDLIFKNRHYNMIEDDLVPFMDKHNFGMYSTNVPRTAPVAIEDIDLINPHIDSMNNDRIDVQSLIEILTSLELCDYTDLSITLDYNDTPHPDVNINYSGSVFNHYSINSCNQSYLGLEINIVQLYKVLINLYGIEKFHMHKPDISVCKTFYEDVYIKFASHTAEDFVCYFDMTIMSVLSPILIDDVSEDYIRKQFLNY